MDIQLQLIQLSLLEMIYILGNYSKSDYMATAIVSKYGVSPTVRENHGQVTGIIVDE